mgnify:CR=1 FL=1
MRRGYLTDNPKDDVYIMSHSPQNIEQLIIGGEEISPTHPQWKINEYLFAGTLDNYGGVFRDLYNVCKKDRENST